MSFLENLLSGGPHHRATRNRDSASRSPINDSDDALEAFQVVVGDVYRHEGDGYVVHLAHPTSDRAEDWIDLIVLQVSDTETM